MIHDFSRICFVFFSGKLANPLQGLEHAFESAGRKTDMIEYAPQERVLSRFACMLESSANGRAWIDFDLASYCDSCADKVIYLSLEIIIKQNQFRRIYAHTNSQKHRQSFVYRMERSLFEYLDRF